MSNLYTKNETNTKDTENQNIEKVEILFDLSGNTYSIEDTSFYKDIVCICGSCDLYMKNNNAEENIKLDNHKITIHIDKGIKAELKNYTKDIKVLIEYFGGNNE